MRLWHVCMCGQQRWCMDVPQMSEPFEVTTLKRPERPEQEQRCWWLSVPAFFGKAYCTVFWCCNCTENFFVERERVNRIDGQNNGVSDLKEQTAQRKTCRDLYAALATLARECELANEGNDDWQRAQRQLTAQKCKWLSPSTSDSGDGQTL